MKPLDLTGQKFGRLTAIEFTGRKYRRGYIWQFLCDCGVFVEVPAIEVRGGKTSSCGCLKTEVAREKMAKIRHLGTAAMTTHGMTGTPTFVCWSSMIQRCSDVNHKSYQDYGGRGIKVCERWLKSFENFFEDMGERPAGMTIDRKENDVGYTPENCRWATGEEQGNNKRSSKLLEFEGRTQTSIQWAREYGICPKVLLYRLKNGWEIKEALTMKPNHGNKHLRGVSKFTA